MNNKNQQIASKRFYDSHHKHRVFPPNAYVWVFKKDARGKKLSDNYEGPFIVIKHKGNNIYDLKNQVTNNTITRHVSCLKACVRRQTNEGEDVISEVDGHNSDSTISYDSDSTEIDSNHSDSTIIYNSSPTSSNATVTSLILLVLTSVVTAQLHIQESPVLWRRTDKLIVSGSKTWDLTVAVKSPCMNLGLADKTVNDQLYTMCQRLYDNEVMATFSTWCVALSRDPRDANKTDKLVKRQALEIGAGIALEYVVSSIVETARGWFKGPSEHSDDEKVTLLSAELNKLQLHANEAYMVEKAHNEVLRTLARQVASNTKELNEPDRGPYRCGGR